MSLLRLVFIVVLCGVGLAAAKQAPFDSADFNKGDQPLELLRIIPSGDDVPPARQIVFHFNRPVVPMGRIERRLDEIPISIEPKLDCEWRWINTASLACQLTVETMLSPATRYRIQVRPEFTTADGATLSEAIRHSFITQRPQVRYARFHTWKAPGLPHIIVQFDQDVDPVSVARRLYLELEDGLRLPVVVAEDPNIVAARKRLQTQPAKTQEQGPDVVGVVSEGHERLVFSGQLPDDQNKLAYAQRSWLVYPETELPLDQKVQLRVEPGIRAASGPEPGAENRTVVAFDTFPEFKFLGVLCTNNADKRVIISPRNDPEAQRCDPLGWTELLFSVPVTKETVTSSFIISPDLAGGRSDYDPWANVHVYAGLSRPHQKDELYSVSLPRGLQAHALYSVVAQADATRDVFGRPLAKNIDTTFATDHRRPKFYLQHKLSVLEKDVETHLPVVVTNLESVRLDYQTLTSQGVTKRSSSVLKVPQVDDVGFRYPIKVRDLLDGRSGAIQSTWRTQPAAPDWDHQTPHWFFSQVTPYHVHVKLGHYNSLVWVTRLDTGEPVDGAEVGVYVDTFGSFNAARDFIARGITTANGVANLPGSVELDPELTRLNTYRRRKPHLFIQVQKGGDMALLPLSYGFRADALGPNRTYLPARLQQPYGHLRSWGFTAQGVYRAGDTVQFKLYVRDQDNRRFIAPPRKGYKLEVIDPTDKAVLVTETVRLSEFGTYDGEFSVPASAAVGWYRFVLSASFSDQTWEPLRVLVSDFTPAPFRVITDLNGERFHPGDILKVSTQAKLHSGGPYGNAQTRLTVTAQGTSLIPSDPRAKGFNFDVQVPEPVTQTVHQIEHAANDKGELEADFSLPEINVLHGRLMVETAVRDDRGKYVAGRATAHYVGRDRYVGIHQPDWLLKSETPTRVQTLVVNEAGIVVEGTTIEVKVEYRVTKAARIKGAGNAYLTRYVHEWKPITECQGMSRREPTDCEFTPTQGGLYRMTATIEDTHGRAHSSELRRWAMGPGQVLWETRPGFALQIIPEKNAYQVGETARFMVQNPFPGAQALVTIERFGVQQHWTTILKTSSEVIEVPVEADALPGFYLSVLIMSPRVEKPLANDQVDLGKPVFRMGYVRVPVKDSSKEITVRVTPRTLVYKPRSRVTIDLQAKTATGATPPMEFAVVVLDEAVFDLISAGRAYYDPYQGFYHLEALDLRNFNLLKQLIGMQRFENKGADSGGGGGGDLTLRSVFKFVSYWNPTIRPNADGKASVSFEVPDNLTGWRVLALAVTHDDLMGLGDGSFQVNQETEIRPALPNQVTAGDRFEARFTVMNRTEFKRTLDVLINAHGAVDGGPANKQLQLTTEPYQRHTIGIPLKAGASGEIRLSVRAQDTRDGDRLVLPLMVRRLQALEAAATYGTSDSDEVTESISFPPDIRTDMGRVSVVASPSVVGGLEGAFEFLRDYPYTCWEQVLTKGAMAAHYLNLKTYLSESFTWPEAAGLPEKTLEAAANYQAPNGGMAYYNPQDRYADPYLSAYTAIAMNWLRHSDYAIPQHVEAKLHDYLYQLLRRDVVPSFYTNGMHSTVRAVALAALAPHGKLTRDDVLRYRSHVKAMSLFGKAHYLMALIRVGATKSAQDEVIDMIRSHANETGGKFAFVEALDFAYKRILDSSLRTNCAVLSALLEHEDRGLDNTQSSDATFKLMQSITQSRKQRDRWENTQENMFCMDSITNFSRKYETQRPQMTLRALLDTETLGQVEFNDYRDSAKDFVRSIQPVDPGRQATVKLQREGVGRYYYAARLYYSPAKLKQTAINAGIEVHREFSVERDGEWRLLENPMTIKIGELVRVDLYVSLPAARNFVVVDDPVPGGLEPVSRDLATASSVDADKGAFAAAGGSYWHRYADWREYGVSFWSFYHKELRHHAARFYSEYLPAGNYHLAYTAQAIAPGEFAVMPVHAEEMYNPDTFGQGVPASLRVEARE